MKSEREVRQTNYGTERENFRPIYLLCAGNDTVPISLWRERYALYQLVTSTVYFRLYVLVCCAVQYTHIRFYGFLVVGVGN